MHWRSCLTLFTLAALASCNVYDASLLDGAGGVGTLPSRPTVVDAGPDVTAVFALHDVLLNQVDADLDANADGQPWRTIGLNLDGRNTRSDSDPNQLCRRPNNVGALTRVDGVNGIDNVLGSTLWPAISTLLPSTPELFESEMNAGFEEGTGTVLLVLHGWNGTANDDSVDIWLLTAAAGSTGAAGEIEFEGGTNRLVLNGTSTGAPTPSWESAETGWYPNRAAFLDSSAATPNRPQIQDLNGYVSNGKIVMKLQPTHTLNLRVANFASVSVRLSNANIVATLSEDLQAIESGFIAGRFSLTDLFAVGHTVGLCDDVNRSFVQSRFDLMADVLADPNDPGGASSICDAVSVGVAFAGVRGTYREVAPQPLCMPALCNAELEPGSGTTCDD